MSTSATKDRCLDCDGNGYYPSGAQCKSCGGTGHVLPGDGEAPSPEQRVADQRLAALIERGVPDGLAPHDFGPIVRELRDRRAQVKELKRLLKYAAVYSSFAKHMPESFKKDSMEALTDEH